MSEFIDRLLVQLSAPAALLALLAPPARLRRLVEASYEFPSATLQDVRDPQVRRVEVQRPLSVPRHIRGRWTQATPAYVSTDVYLDADAPDAPLWIDLSAELAVTAVLDIDVGQIESVLVTEITGFQTLDEFRARFRYLDPEAFLHHGIRDIDELRQNYRPLLAEIRLRPLPAGPFDPNDPANQRRLPLGVALLIRDRIDVAAVMRDARLARQGLEQALTYRTREGEAEVRSPYALVLVLPQDGLAGLALTQAELETFFARERVLALFVTPA